MRWIGIPKVIVVLGILLPDTGCKEGGQSVDEKKTAIPLDSIYSTMSRGAIKKFVDLGGFEEAYSELRNNTAGAWPDVYLVVARRSAKQ